ncbi:MAG: hypothetical protein NTW86_25055, partial [Candidatus Sumerlaeota bacterium]|nr:hypothetical protein [Candidatus Sumerlaeota bacterium]
MKTPSTLRSWKAAVWILVFAALFASRIMQIVDHDVFLHARSGWWMIEQRTFPRTDPFSLLAGGERWVNHQWLAQILIALGSAKAIGGFATLGLIRAALATLSYFLIFLAMRERSAGVWPALIALITGALAAWRYSEPRPYIITYVMMAWIAWAWAAWKARRSRAIYWTPALMIVWANCHGGFTAGLAFLGALAAGQTLEYGVPPLGG